MNKHLWKVKWHQSFYDKVAHETIDCGTSKRFVITFDPTVHSIIDKLKDKGGSSVTINIIKATYLGEVIQ